MCSPTQLLISPVYEHAAVNTRAFSSEAEALDVLNKLDGYFNSMVWAEHSHCMSFVDHECQCLDDCECAGCLEWVTFERQVGSFSLRLKPLVETLVDDPSKRQHALRLQLLDMVWQWIVQDEGKHLNDDEREELGEDSARKLLDLAERILTLSAERPTYSLSADIIPTLITVFDTCRSQSPKQRVIDLLRKHPRTEFIFNGEQVAAYLEHHMSQMHLEVDPASVRCAVDPSRWPAALLEFVPPST